MTSRSENPIPPRSAGSEHWRVVSEIDGRFFIQKPHFKCSADANAHVEAQLPILAPGERLIVARDIDTRIYPGSANLPFAPAHFSASPAGSEPIERQMAVSADEMGMLLVRVAETQDALAVCERAMGRAAMMESEGPSQDEWERLCQEACDAVEAVVEWWNSPQTASSGQQGCAAQRVSTVPESDHGT